MEIWKGTCFLMGNHPLSSFSGKRINALWLAGTGGNAKVACMYGSSRYVTEIGRIQQIRKTFFLHLKIMTFIHTICFVTILTLSSKVAIALTLIHHFIVLYTVALSKHALNMLSTKS